MMTLDNLKRVFLSITVGLSMVGGLVLASTVPSLLGPRVVLASPDPQPDLDRADQELPPTATATVTVTATPNK